MARLWIIVEPILLLVAVGLLMRLLAPSLSPEQLLLATPPDWTGAAKVEALFQGLRWALLLLVAWLIARRRGFSPLRPVGGKPGALSSTRKVLLGLAAGIPLNLFAMLPRWYHYEVRSLGETPPIWDVIYTAEWTLGFWLFMAVGSYLLIPVVEETFFRGYVFGSLLRRFSPGWAIALSAVVFAAVHLQYLAPDAFALFNSGSLLVSTIVTATLVYLTRSLVPAIVAHAYGNIPQPLSWIPYETALLIPAAALLIWLLPKLLSEELEGRVV